MDDRTFKMIVAASAAALVGALMFVRFCGDLAVPAKPDRAVQTASVVPATDVLVAASASPAAWQGFLENDAVTAHVVAPTPQEMTRVLPHAVDNKPRTLAPGAPPVEVAGLRLSVERDGADGDEQSLILSIENTSDVDRAYQVVTRPSVGEQTCRAREILFYDANVVAARRRERRSECVYRDGMVLNISRVESVELPPLAAWYVSRVPPTALTVDTRLIKGHKPLSGASVCNVMMSQAIRSGLETGEIEWRDLVDFYARHRCDTYQFPHGYKAFRTNGERQPPVVDITR
jgi:hypothetical protein